MPKGFAKAKDGRRMLGGLTHREIARLLGTSHGNVVNIERRALEKMRAAAEREGIEAADLFEVAEKESETSGRSSG